MCDRPLSSSGAIEIEVVELSSYSSMKKGFPVRLLGEERPHGETRQSSNGSWNEGTDARYIGKIVVDDIIRTLELTG